MSCIYESLWREGLNMDSSIFSDDDFLDWRWPASSPRRCDREIMNGTHGLLGMDYSTHRNNTTRPSSCSRSNSSKEEIFFYCTEELGSESTSGVVDFCIAPISSYNCPINEKWASSSSFTFTPNTTTSRNLYTYEKEYMSSKQQASSTPTCLIDSRESFSSSSRSTCVNATTSGRNTHEEYNWAFKQQACASSICIKSTSPNLEVEGASKISSHGHIFDSNAPHHHHCRAVSGGGNHTFPPPIASLLTDRPLMRSFKSNGRFILKKVANVSRSLFRSSRRNGCLRLDLLPSSFDCLESSLGLEGAAAESTTSDVTHDYDHGMESSPPFHCLSTPSPYSRLHQKPTLKYGTLCPPSKLQAFGMLMHSKGPCSPSVEESISTSSISFQAGHLIKGQTGGNTDMAQSTPHVFAVLKLLPSGLGLIIFEIGKSKGGDHITVYGMYILNNFGFQCSSRAAMSPSHHLLTNSFGITSEEPKGKLFPFEDCKTERYTKGVFS